MKIVTILGARPQFVKASAVSRALARVPQVREVLVHTGQHFDPNMSQVFFDELELAPPDHHLGIHGGSHGEMTGRMLQQVEKVLLQEDPAAVVVYGDTNSTLAGALAAVKLHIRVAHVEAGLRSFNWRMPEEINRILTDRISTWLFSPTSTATSNLRFEGVAADRIEEVGDVMLDVSLHYARRADERGRLLADLGLARSGYVLATVHRAENTDDPLLLETLLCAFAEVALALPVVWPVHPRTRAVLGREDLLQRRRLDVHLIDPVGYLDMVQLERHAAVIATDSGGVQKESFFHGVPCVTLRSETEWGELVDSGWNRVVPLTEAGLIAQAILSARGVRGDPVQPYGDGKAAEKIVARLLRDLQN